jgi:hypothetical protein
MSITANKFDSYGNVVSNINPNKLIRVHREPTSIFNIQDIRDNTLQNVICGTHTIRMTQREMYLTTASEMGRKAFRHNDTSNPFINLIGGKTLADAWNNGWVIEKEYFASKPFWG